MNNNKEDWDTLFKFIDDNEETNFIDVDINEKENEKENQFNNYYKDYKKLVSIDSLLKSKTYYQNKYFIIAKHLVNMDDFYLALEQKNIKYYENSSGSSFLSQSINSKKIKSKLNSNNSTGSKIKKELNEFKLGYTKTLLEIFENEKMTGKEFEEYARRTLYLMFLMLKKDNYKIYNPKKALLNGFEQYLQNYYLTEIKKQNEKIFFYENCCEIDIIINDFEKSDFIELIQKYPNNFYFTDELQLDSIDGKFNIIGEIARNLIYQSNNKKHQIDNYINIFRGFNIIKQDFNQNKEISNNIDISGKMNININKSMDDKNEKNDIDVNIKKKINNKTYKSNNKSVKGEKINKEKDLQNILKSFELNDISKENIFLLVTNGPFLLFKIIFDMLKELFVKEEEEEKKELYAKYLEERINHYTEIINTLTESKKNIIEKVKNLYSIFKDLRAHHIKHCVIYVGTNSENLKDNEIFKGDFITSNQGNSGELKEFSEIIRIKKGINNMMSIKNELDDKFDLYAKNVNKKLLEKITKTNILEIIKLKNSYKLKLNIYLREEKKIEEDEYFIIKTEKINTNFDNNEIKKWLNELFAKNNKQELYLIILPNEKRFELYTYSTNDNIIIILEGNENINEIITTRFNISGGVFKRYIEGNFEIEYMKKMEKLNSYLSSIPDTYDINSSYNYINKEIGQEFIIDNNSFNTAYKILNIETEIKDDLIEKIIDNIKETTIQNNINDINLKEKIRKNITRLEERIKIILFNNFFINVILLKAFKKSIDEKFYNLNDHNLKF